MKRRVYFSAAAGATTLVVLGILGAASFASPAVGVTPTLLARGTYDSFKVRSFPQGPDDDSVVLLKVEADSAEYWDSPGSRLATVFSFVKAKVTGERIESGENEKVDL